MHRNPRKAAAESDKASDGMAIEMFHIPTRSKTIIPVRATLGGRTVTHGMVAADVKLLNEMCGVNGRTMEKLPRNGRTLVFKALTL